ncbi:hypothetical protein [Nocardioides sp. GY 10113]|uniref:hypothetical protein n=1 Tax=Nocardioides sp. GY 10113 TaxID=2569761 RepID=UPI001458A086|nr:hypothetical protein [Nocardioides sp. GY 10113]
MVLLGIVAGVSGVLLLAVLVALPIRDRRRGIRAARADEGTIQAHTSRLDRYQ